MSNSIFLDPVRTDYGFIRGLVSFAEKISPTTSGKLYYPGDISVLSIEQQVERIKRNEYMTGGNGQVRSRVKTVSLGLKMTLHNTSREALEKLTLGEGRTVSGVAITNEVLNGGLSTVPAVGDVFKLKHWKLDPGTAPVVHDSAGTPVVIDPAKYEIDYDYGKITIIAALPGGTIGPLKINYTSLDYDVVAAQTLVGRNFEVFFEGVNKGNDDDTREGLQVYSLSLDPASSIQVISEDFGSYELSGMANQVQERAVDPDFGGFARWIKLGVDA